MSARTRDVADYYATLGIAPTATSAEIRRAYRDLARTLHPDVNKALDAAARFAALTEAYDTLASPERRRAYDLARSGVSGPATWAGGAVPEVAVMRDRPPARRAGSPAPPAEPSLRGLDVHQTVHLSLREAAFGTDKTIAVPRREVCASCRGAGAAPSGTVRQCPRCHGTGRGPHKGEECPRCHGNGGLPSVPCSTCNGLGRLPDEAVFPLHFPPAVEDGEELRIKNEGDPGPRGGPRGDLRLRVVVEPDPVLRRRGAEVYADLIITPWQAAQGCRIEVPTLRRPRHLRLPRDVREGDTFIMRGQGLRLKGTWRRGDQHVTVHLEEGYQRE